MSIKNIFIMLLTTMFFACSQQAPQESFQTFDLKKSQDILPISSFAKKVDYIELKVSEVGLELGEIEDIKLIGGDLIVKHRLSGKSGFLRFTGNGEFVIELVGEKTSGVTDPKDLIAYDEGYAVLAGNGIFIVSSDGKYKGELVGETMPGSRFFFANGSFHVINETLRGYLLQTFPAEDLTKYSSKKLAEPVQRMIYSSVQTFGKNEVHFYSALNDTVFRFNGNITEPVYALQGNNMPTFAQLCEKTGDLDDKETLRLLRENEHVIVRKYLENHMYIFVTYWVGSNSSTAIVNKKSGDIRYFGHGVNDLDGGVWDKVIRLTDKDELLVPLRAHKVAGHKITNKREKRFAALQKRITASSNPVIMRVKLR